MRVPGSRLFAALDRYWFAAGSLSELAFVRIVVVGSHLLFFYPDLERQFERAGWPPQEFVALPALKVLLLPFGTWGLRPEAMLLEGVWLLGIVAGIGALLGKYTNLSLLAFAASLSLLTSHAYSYGLVHHPEGLPIMMLWALALSPCGRRWALDDLQWRLRHAGANVAFSPLTPEEDLSPLARWPLLFAQWILAIAYFSAGTGKLFVGGLDWFRSSTLAYYLVQDGIRWERPLGLIMAGLPEVLVVLAVGTVLFEATFFLAIFLPRVTWVYLLTGAGMHLGIGLMMQAWFMGWVVLYSSFIPTLRQTFPWSWVREKVPAPQRWTLIYDGRCPLCIRSMVLIDYLDLRRSLEFIDLEEEWHRVEGVAPALTRERALHLMHLVTPEGALVGGFNAFAELTRGLPLLWPLAPLLRNPLARRWGPAVYGWVSVRRGRTPCGAAGCRVREVALTPGS